MGQKKKHFIFITLILNILVSIATLVYRFVDTYPEVKRLNTWINEGDSSYLSSYREMHAIFIVSCVLASITLLISVVLAIRYMRQNSQFSKHNKMFQSLLLFDYLNIVWQIITLFRGGDHTYDIIAGILFVICLVLVAINLCKLISLANSSYKKRSLLDVAVHLFFYGAFPFAVGGILCLFRINDVLGKPLLICGIVTCGVGLIPMVIHYILGGINKQTNKNSTNIQDEEIQMLETVFETTVKHENEKQDEKVEKTNEPAVKICAYCGCEYEIDDKKCPSCGARKTK